MKLLLVILVWTITIVTEGSEIKLSENIYSPIFRDPGETDVAVGPIFVDKTPVTNKEFLKFLVTHPRYFKSKIPKLLADAGYLSHWPSNTTFLISQALFPVTNVSWFAARKYCESKGQRLPTIAEWEVVSDAQNPENEIKILNWYSKVDSALTDVGHGPSNKFGIKDSHNLIWEWVENFSETIMSGDSRGGGPTESLFCGAASLNAKDPRLYAAFMRFAFRSSLTANYTSKNLGFRCVRNMKEGSQ